jgi:hypothetical protein
MESKTILVGASCQLIINKKMYRIKQAITEIIQTIGWDLQ